MARSLNACLCSLGIDRSHHFGTMVKLAHCVTQKFARRSIGDLALDLLRKGQARQRWESVFGDPLQRRKPSTKCEIISCEDFVLVDDPSENFAFVLSVRPPDDASSVTL